MGIHQATEGLSAIQHSPLAILLSVLDLLPGPNEKEYTNPYWIYPDGLALHGQAALYLPAEESYRRLEKPNFSGAQISDESHHGQFSPRRGAFYKIYGNHAVSHEIQHISTIFNV